MMVQLFLQKKKLLPSLIIFIPDVLTYPLIFQSYSPLKLISDVISGYISYLACPFIFTVLSLLIINDAPRFLSVLFTLYNVIPDKFLTLFLEV